MSSAGNAAPGRAYGRTLDCRGLRRSTKERHHGHSQARRERMNHGQGRVRPAGLDAAEVRAEQPAAFGEIVLREPACEAKLSHTFTEDSLGGDSHPGTLVKVHSFIHTLIRTSGARMGKWSLAGRTIKALAVAAAVGGCATADMKAESSAIAVGKSLVLESVPLGGLAVQAVVSAGDGDDRGSYKYKSQLFCQTNSQALANIRQKFAVLCERKGAQFDGQFCARTDGVDRVLFSAQLESQGSGGCYRLNVSEAVTVGSSDYLQFLISKAGYETAEVKAQKLAAQQAAATDARAKARAEQQAREARDLARLQVELPFMRKRGARVCLMQEGNSVVYRGYVEDFSDEKLKIDVAEAFLANSPFTRPTGFQRNTLWDYPVRWRIC